MNRFNKQRKNAWVATKAIHPASDSILRRFGTAAALLNDGRFRTNPYRHYSNRTIKNGLTVWWKNSVWKCTTDQYISHLMMLRGRVRELYRWRFRY